LGLSDKAGVGNSAVPQVFVTDAALTVTGIVGGASRGDDDGSNPSLEEIKGMVEPGAVYRRRLAGVLRCAENDDGVGGVNFLQGRFADDAYTN
jgi:hypothetical protein